MNLGLCFPLPPMGRASPRKLWNLLPREECIVSVSLDGIESHKEMRRRTSFDETVAKLMLLKSNGIRSAVMTTLTNHNLPELERIFEFTTEHDLFFGITPFSPIGRGRRHSDLSPGKEIAERASPLYFKNYLDRIEKMKRTGLCVQKFLSFSYKLAHAMRREFCGISLAYICSDGAVYPCSVCASNQKFPAGNLRERDFSDIWDNCFNDIRRITFDDFNGCKTCEIAHPKFACAGRCPVMSEVYTGKPDECGASPFLMEANRLNGKRISEFLQERD